MISADLPLPPRLVIEVVCAHTRDGCWLARSSALPGIVAGGASADAAADKLRLLAEGIAGEPVDVFTTSGRGDIEAEHDDERA